MSSTCLAAQMYTVREFTKTPADIAASIKKVRALGYEAMQTSAFGDIDPKELKKIADDEGMAICATHISFEQMRDDTQAVIDEHNIWECKYPAIGGMPAEYREAGGDGYRRFAVEASEVARKLADAGLTFAYHNHSHELERFGDRTGLDILFEDSDPEVFQMEIDTYWIQHGGADPAAWIRKAAGRSDLVHVKDMRMKGREQLFAEVGEGNLNWSSIVEASKEAGAKWYIVEQDQCYDRDCFDSLGISLKNLKAMGLQ